LTGHRSSLPVALRGNTAATVARISMEGSDARFWEDLNGSLINGVLDCHL
jgi:hypothetical protein